MNMNELFKELYLEKYGAKISKDMAEKIVKGFAVTDGSSRLDGEKWNFEETIHFGEKTNVDFSKIDKVEWYLVLNMVYSDNFKTQKKYALPDSFYSDLAMDWICDVDRTESKTFDYFIHL